MENKRILFVLGNYYPKPYANSICAQNIIDLYLKDNCVVDVICIQRPGSERINKLNGVNLHYVQPNFRLKMFLLYADTKNKFFKILYHFLGKLMSFAFRLFCFPWLPRMSFSLSNRYYKCIKDLAENNSYDGVISFVNPLDGALGMVKFKKRTKKHLKWIVYCIDTLTNSKDKTHPKKCYLYKKFLQYCDKYIVMKSNKTEYGLPYLNDYKDKISVCDLPFVLKSDSKIDENTASLYQFDNNHEHWSYFGSIGGKHYSYVDFLDFFFALPDDKKRVLHFFTRGSDINYDFASKESEYKKVIMHGYVNPETMSTCLECSDILVSIKYSNVISAKYLQYMSLGKRIIHFSGCESDPDIKYLSKYNNAIILTPYISSFEEMVKYFLAYKENKSMSFEEVKKVFIQNTPEFSKKIIDEAIN